MLAEPIWFPSLIVQQIQALPTDSRPVEVETDAGFGFLKVCNDRGSPHALAADLVGTKLAKWLGLPTAEFAVMSVAADDPLELFGGARVVPGPGFITRTMVGTKWDGHNDTLAEVDNPNDLGRLVAFDTWTLNCDRYRPPDDRGRPSRNRSDNVFLSADGAAPGRYRVMALDQGACFRCDGDLTASRLRAAAADDTLFGHFPGFRGRARREDALAGADRIECITVAEVREIVDAVPAAWDVDNAARDLLADLIYQRSRRVRGIITRSFPQTDLYDGPGGRP